MAEFEERAVVRALGIGVNEYTVELTAGAVAAEVQVPYTLAEFVVPDVEFAANAQLDWWSSDWGAEWQPQLAGGRDGVDLSITAGRSSKGAHPFLVVRDESTALLLAVAWSGNWRISARVDEAGKLRVTAGLDQPVLHRLPAGQSVSSPAVITSVGSSVNDASGRLIAAMRASNPRPQALRTEWNHWWPYEDLDINAEVFLANASAAKQVGLEVAVLDAGWFGGDGAHWHDVRGDWQLRSLGKFPDGIAGLAEQTRALGIEFGIWLEPEAIGKDALLNTTQPELVARSADGQSLGYVCLGSAAGREFVRATVAGVLNETKASWLKWDFNIDPGAGCQRTDHGHGATDGLFSHVLQLYALLDELRAQFPHTVFENCSSGGLRWDLGIAAHFDVGFASDPDWPEHALCCRWASSIFFPPEQQLGWCNSEWRGTHAHQSLKASEGVKRSEVDLLMTISMLGGLGLSQKLCDWLAAEQARVAELLAVYETCIKPRLATSSLERLTAQPQRAGAGERQVLFRLVTPGQPDLWFAFNIGDEPWQLDLQFAASEVCELLDGRRISLDSGRLRLGLSPQSAAVIELQ